MGEHQGLLAAFLWYNTGMRTIAENANDFADLRTADGGNCIYVDKTDYFHRLVTAGSKKLFFIARPRRFGKSLMITTFKYIFQGRRELFKGLKIDRADYDWKVHPVIHIDFGCCAAATYAVFRDALPNVMRIALEASGYTYDKGLSPAMNFLNAVIWHFNRGTPCVVLIDEYDDPVAKTLANPAEAELVRNELAAIYGQIKGKADMIRFLMITGVSKFTKMSVFSALSNLTDISPLPEYAEMLGYTEDDLDEYFGEHMAAHAKVMDLTDGQYRAELKRWYNGYRFSPDKPVTVYNPVSTGLTFAYPRNEFRGTWTATGRPSMLMNFIRREGLLAIDYEKGVTARENDFDVTDIRNLRAVAMLYQTGYLTIKDYRDGRYLLGIPDEEVRRDLLLLVAAQSAERDETWVGQTVDHLLDGEFDDFFDGLRSLFAHLPYGEKEERTHEMNFERNLKILFWAFGYETVCEDRQTGGRADIVVKYSKAIYVFELKRDGTAADALAQIREKGYEKPYLADGRPVYLIGLAFDSKTRQLVDAAWEADRPA